MSAVPFVAANEEAPLAPPAAGKSAALLANLIERDILASDLPVGVVLGSRQELCERYGVTAAILHEATRLLTQNGLGHMRRGRRGGFVIAIDAMSAASFAMASYLESVGAPVEDIAEVAASLEALAIRLAWDSIDVEKAMVLRRHVARLRKPSGDRAADLAALRTLQDSFATIACGRALAIVLSPLLLLIFEYVEIEDLEQEAFDDLMAEVSVAWHDLVEALIAGDSKPPSIAPLAYGYYLRRRDKRREDGRPDASTRDERGGHRLTHAEKLARRIRQDLHREGWKPGHYIGSEVQLLARYGVSRAVFRQAIRLLERHEVVRMRAGRGGGLAVCAPKSDNAVRSCVLYLEAAGISPHEMLEMRETLMLHALRGCPSRMTPATADELRRLVDACADGRGVDLLHRNAAVHFKIFEIAGSPTADFLFRILLSVGARHPTYIDMDEEEMRTIVTSGNQALADAVARRDGALACRAFIDMDRHWRAALRTGVLRAPSESFYGELEAGKLADQGQERWPVADEVGPRPRARPSSGGRSPRGARVREATSPGKSS